MNMQTFADRNNWLIRTATPQPCANELQPTQPHTSKRKKRPKL